MPQRQRIELVFSMTLSDPYLPQGTHFLHFFVAFHIIEIGGDIDFEFNIWVYHNKFQPMYDKASRKGAGPGSFDPFHILTAPWNG